MDSSKAISDKLAAFCQANHIILNTENFNMVCKEALTEEEYHQCFLSHEVGDQLDALAQKGDAAFERGSYRNAIKTYQKGLDLLPEPRNLWEAKLWFTAAIADAYWFLEKYPEALEFLDESLVVEGGHANPFIRLRRGQVLFELGRMEEAREELLKGYKLGGEELFEDEDEKYLDLIA
ncbi:MAG: hypothetical protein HRU41_31815 [Saprospiraceae bacterium]|nr:hypothetical protein [Saprospiraceae bacterium]